VNAIGSRHSSGRVMKEDAIIATMRRFDQLHKEMAFVRKILIGKLTLM
jgi:hypothetical protein